MYLETSITLGARQQGLMWPAWKRPPQAACLFFSGGAASLSSKEELLLGWFDLALLWVWAGRVTTQ